MSKERLKKNSSQKKNKLNHKNTIINDSKTIEIYVVRREIYFGKIASK